MYTKDIWEAKDLRDDIGLMKEMGKKIQNYRLLIK